MRTAEHEQARYTMMTPAECAEEGKLSPQFILDEIHRGRIRGVKRFGGPKKFEYRIPRESWLEYFEQADYIPKNEQTSEVA